MPQQNKQRHVYIRDVARFLADLAPLHLAEDWDNVGLLTGNSDERVRRILLTIDLTPAVADEAIKSRTNLLISYHPPIFKAQKKFCFNAEDPPALAAKLAAHRVWIYSPHTALDVADGGTNDVLAETIGAKVVGSFTHAQSKGSYLKLVTFIPKENVEAVAEALFAAGCGHIGAKAKYSKCSFRSEGTGTFMGDESSNPAVGERGVYERQPEIRFETILSARIVGEVVTALKESHPYEEPAFDLLPMQMPPEAVGLGRIAALPRTVTLKKFAQQIAATLKLPAVQVVGDVGAKIRTIGVLAGSVGRLALDLPDPQKKFDALITGELKHHDALAYQAAGIPVICLGHSHSERPMLATLSRKITAAFPDIAVEQSAADADPFSNIPR